MNANTAAWSVSAESAKGPHKAINQDRHSWRSFGDGSEMALAVADGHGSSAHPRSDTGAELAVSAFLEAASDFRTSIQQEDELSQLKCQAEDDLPRNLVLSWQHLVEQHWAGNPIADADPATASPALLYGTTLVGALITDALVVGWQLGDGDLCFIDADGQITTPLHRRTETLGDETDSLCSSNAQLLVHTYWAPSPQTDAPVLVAMSTDGLSKSFVSFDSYLEFLTGLHNLLRTDNAQKVQREIPGWLQKASSYSGDDTTLIVAWREYR